MKQPYDFISLTSNELHFQFIPTGDIFEMTSGPFLINQFRGNAKDGSANNIYLRVYENNTLKSVYPLLGQLSKSHVTYQKDFLRFEGNACDITYRVDLFLVENSWFYEISLKSEHEVTVDLLYGQDIGLSGIETVLTNELYISQYLGHTAFESEHGYIICSRQNMPDENCNPYLQQGCLFHNVQHYSTDGLDFFGLDYKASNIPHALIHGLTDRNLQYEFAYTGLLTETFTFSGENKTVFYGHFIKNHPKKIETPEYQSTIELHYATKPSYNGNFIPAKTFTIKNSFGKPQFSKTMSEDEVRSFFPIQNLREESDSNLYSFFSPTHTHVVTMQKEEQVQRPHGTIVMTPPKTDTISESLIASTHYMYGVFNSHIVLGNTNMHKFISTPRGFLNIHKNSGQRIYVKSNDQFHLLTLPALYEMGMNFSRWYYALEGDILLITSYSTNQSPQIHLEVSSMQHISYDFIVTNQLSLGLNEYSHEIEGEHIDNGMHFRFGTDKYKDLNYDIYAMQDCVLSDDRIFYEEDLPFDETFLTMSFEKTSDIHIVMQGNYGFTEYPAADSFEEEERFARERYALLMKNFSLDAAKENEKLSILNETAWWYTHNAMIHFCMPHGLEQPGGAAWGTRDICQGPIEYFSATGNMPMVRAILLNVFSHQEDATKEWPQWFMFDKYEMNAGECHGDVIFWPLKSISDYLIESNDYQILEELLPYADKKEKIESLFAHIKSAVSLIIETRFIKDTGLITYAGGDWDDTLQPAQPEMKEKLVSAWTQALAFQTFKCLSQALKNYDFTFSTTILELAERVKKAFEDYTIQDGIIAGFLEWDGSVEYLLHPKDTQTGIHYRLLPQTRSIIAELVSKKQAVTNIRVIHEKLECPDGVRLMDAPASYDGGVSHLFKRAEQAANVGREISLQYTHAHIRYVEAMAKYGNAKNAWDGIFKINPVLIQKSVKNACLRQSNMYFSSSEGDYADRYEYQKDFHLLKTGSIPVKGGWRLYSSGPGIYMHQIISHILGIRFRSDAIIIDPVLPDDLCDFTFQFDCFGEACTFHYKKSDCNNVSVLNENLPLSCTTVHNLYRNSGIEIKKDIFLASLKKEFTILY